MKKQFVHIELPDEKLDEFMHHFGRYGEGLFDVMRRLIKEAKGNDEEIRRKGRASVKRLRRNDLTQDEWSYISKKARRSENLSRFAEKYNISLKDLQYSLSF